MCKQILTFCVCITMHAKCILIHMNPVSSFLFLYSCLLAWFDIFVICVCVSLTLRLCIVCLNSFNIISFFSLLCFLKKTFFFSFFYSILSLCQHNTHTLSVTIYKYTVNYRLKNSVDCLIACAKNKARS